MLERDAEWRQQIFEMERLKKDLNDVNKEIGQRKKVDRTDACTDAVAKTAALKQAVANAETLMKKTEALRDTLLAKIGNLVHASVIPSMDEANNEVILTRFL